MVAGRLCRGVAKSEPSRDFHGFAAGDCRLAAGDSSEHSKQQPQPIALSQSKPDTARVPDCQRVRCRATLALPIRRGSLAVCDTLCAPSIQHPGNA